MYKLKTIFLQKKNNFEYFEQGTTFYVFFSQDFYCHIIAIMSMSKHEQA